MRIRFNKRALQVMKDMVEYGVDNFGLNVALEMNARLEKRINHLRVFPELGFPEPLLVNKKRQYRALMFEKRYKIIYHISYEKETVFISDIWDLRMCPAKLLNRIR